MSAKKSVVLAAAATMCWTAWSGAAPASDVCHTAPLCSQYDRRACFGFYGTRWRRWEEACAAPRPVFGTPTYTPPTVAPAWTPSAQTPTAIPTVPSTIPPMVPPSVAPAPMPELVPPTAKPTSDAPKPVVPPKPIGTPTVPPTPTNSSGSK